MTPSTPSSSPRNAVPMQIAASAAALFVAALGIVVLVGWLLGLPPLVQVVPGAIAMVPNTALAFFLSGMALWFRTGPRRVAGRGASLTVAAGAGLIGLLTLLEYVSGASLGIDELLFRDPAGLTAAFPGRMAATTAISFVVFAAALFLSDRRDTPWVADTLATVPGLLGLFSLTCYVYGVPRYYWVGTFKAMAIHTALGFMGLTAGALLAHPEGGASRLIRSDTSGGIVARRILPAALVVPLLLAWLGLLAFRAEAFVHEFEDALIAMSGVVVLLAILVVVAERLRRTDEEKERLLETQRDSEAKLRAFIDSNVVGITFADLRGPIFDANDEYLRLIGYSRDELKAGHVRWDALTPPEFRPLDEKGIAEAKVRGVCTPYEKQYQRRDGTRVSILVGYVLLPPDRKTAIGFILDITRRAEAETALREAERKYRSIFENAVEGIFQTTPDGRLAAANPSFARMLGYDSPEELLSAVRDVGRELWAHPERREEYRRLLESQGVVRGFESELRRKDGSLVWVSENTRAVRGPSGTVEYFEGTLEDTTERRRIERALRKSRATMVELLDASPDSTLLLDRNYAVLACNRAMASRLGLSFTEVIGRSVLELLPPDIGKSRRAKLDEANWTGRTVRFRDERSGFVFDNTIVPITDASGHVRQIAVFGRDVTAVVRAEAELEKRELYFRSLIENSLDITVVIAPDGEIRYVSPSVGRILGYNPAEVVGRSIFELLHPDEEAENVDRLRRTLAEGSRFERLEVRARHRDGSWRNISATGQALPPETEIPGVIINARDLTERHQLEAQLRHSQKMEAVGRLAGGVAHDFNNLLTVIQGYAEMLIGSLADDEARREEVAEILRAADRASMLTRQLLAFSRRQVFDARVLDLREVVGETEKMVRRLIGEDVELVVANPASLGRVKADPGQIVQILMNLAVNARDAMQEGGRLLILLEDFDLELPLHSPQEVVPPGRYVVLSVSDTGSGMDEKTRSHLFEPFFTTKEKGKGTGLGLSTVFGIVKQSGGFFDVESAPGQGAMFRIFLPRIDGEEGTVPGVREAGTGGIETILLVEDEAAVRGLAHRFLEGRGYRVLTAESGEKALDLLERNEESVHLLVTDLVMPGMNGRLLAQKVASRWPGTRVLFVSGYASDVFSRHDPAGKGEHLLMKPFTDAALAKAVREALDAPSPGSSGGK